MVPPRRRRDSAHGSAEADGDGSGVEDAGDGSGTADGAVVTGGLDFDDGWGSADGSGSANGGLISPVGPTGWWHLANASDPRARATGYVARRVVVRGRAGRSLSRGTTFDLRDMRGDSTPTGATGSGHRRRVRLPPPPTAPPHHPPSPAPRSAQHPGPVEVASLEVHLRRAGALTLT